MCPQNLSSSPVSACVSASVCVCVRTRVPVKVCTRMRRPHHGPSVSYPGLSVFHQPGLSVSLSPSLDLCLCLRTSLPPHL